MGNGKQWDLEFVVSVALESRGVALLWGAVKYRCQWEDNGIMGGVNLSSGHH